MYKHLTPLNSGCKSESGAQVSQKDNRTIMVLKALAKGTNQEKETLTMASIVWRINKIFLTYNLFRCYLKQQEKKVQL